MTDAFNATRTPVIAEESASGDAWHIYSARGDQIAAITGQDAEEVAKLAAIAINAPPAGEAHGEASMPAQLAAPVAPGSNFVFRGMTTWDWYAGQALAGLAGDNFANGPAAVAEWSGGLADAMIAERAKRGIGR